MFYLSLITKHLIARDKAVKFFPELRTIPLKDVNISGKAFEHPFHFLFSRNEIIFFFIITVSAEK